jgi:hypothetical protein
MIGMGMTRGNSHDLLKCYGAHHRYKVLLRVFTGIEDKQRSLSNQVRIRAGTGHDTRVVLSDPAYQRRKPYWLFVD